MIPTHNTIPYDAKPYATNAIIGACALAFLYQLTLSSEAAQQFLLEYALVPARYVSGSWAADNGLSRADPTPFLTSMFLHGGFLHILSNMWVLWVFGPALEDRLGVRRFVGLYLVAGLAAGVTHVVFNLFSAIPTIGASGAIAGIIGAYVRRFPYAWINVLQPVGLMPVFLFMPALMFAGIWFFSQIMQAAGSALMPGGGGGVAWMAHVGGFVAGWFLVPKVAPPKNAIQESRSATESATWPVREMGRWVRWWLRRGGG